MFEFFNDMGTYEDRKIGRLDQLPDLLVSTAYVSDGQQPYETAIVHPRYNEGQMIIVEAYDTKADAKIGHDKWVKKMTAKRPPKELVDCCNSHIGQMLEGFRGKPVYKLDGKGE